MTVLRRPYDEQPAHDDLAARRRAGCSALSCCAMIQAIGEAHLGAI